MFKPGILFLPAVFICLHTYAQVSLPVPGNIQSAYEKGTRTLSGQPGKQYWQNSANYTIQVNYNPDTRLLTGTVNIEYVNNSRDTLNQVVFKLYPNLYKTGKIGRAHV